MNTPSAAIICVFIAYTLLCWILFGPLPSLSATFYLWKDRRKFSAAWSIFAGIIMALCIAQKWYVQNEFTLFWFILAGASMWFLTIAGPYKQYPLLHYVPTVATILFGFLAVYTEYGKGVYLPLVVFAAGAMVMTVLKVPNKLTWIELLAVACIFIRFVL